MPRIVVSRLPFRGAAEDMSPKIRRQRPTNPRWNERRISRAAQRGQNKIRCSSIQEENKKSEEENSLL